MTNPTSTRPPAMLPGLQRLYLPLDTMAETLLRVVAGILLVTHGYGKIINPFGTVDMVESLGFYPGVFWSPLLAATEFFGGLLVAIGLLTRMASFAATIVLLVAIYFEGIIRGGGLAGVEISILWAAVFFFFVIRGSNAQSLDAKIGKQI